MSDLQLLFLVLACLYAWECVCWLRRGSVAFVTWFGKRWHAAHPGSFVGNQHGSFVLAPPLPPLGHIVVSNQLPLSLSAEGVLAYVATNVNPGWRPQQSGRFIAFDAIKAVGAKGKKLDINGNVFFKANSPHYAAHLAHCVQSLQKLPKAERPAAIEKMFRESFDRKAAEKRWAEFERLTPALPWLTNGLLVYLFALGPAMIWHFGLKQTWLPLLIGVFVLTSAIALFFRRAHKILYPAAEEDRFTHFLTLLLSPATAMRAQDILSRPLLETFHPVAIASVFCTEENFRRLAQRVVLDVRHPALPLCPSSEPAAEATERESRTTLQAAMETFLNRNKAKVDDLVRPPKPLEDSCRAFCPRCHAQFTRIEGTCSDCGGLALKAFQPQMDTDAHGPGVH